MRKDKTDDYKKDGTSPIWNVFRSMRGSFLPKETAWENLEEDDYLSPSFSFGGYWSDKSNLRHDFANCARDINKAKTEAYEKFK